MLRKTKFGDHLRWPDLAAILFLFATLIVASARLVATDWVEHLAQIPTVMLIGALAGVALGYSIFSWGISLLYSLIYGVFAIGWQLGLTMENNISWHERLVSLAGRLSETAQQVVKGENVNDSILFLVAMMFLFWLLGASAGYSITRHGDPWTAMLPAGAALFIIHINDKFWPFRAWYLGLFLVLALMLVARVNYLRLRHQWQQNHTRTPTYIGLDMSRAALLAAVPLVLVAWTAPALAVALPAAQENWQEFSAPIRSRFDNLFASLRATVGVVSDYYSDTLSLGMGNQLSDIVVMNVEAPTFRPGGVRYYWRARAYDLYSNNTWSTGSEVEEPIRSTIFQPEIARLPYRWDATLTFNPRIPLRTVHTVSETYSVSRPGNAILFRNDDQTVDITALMADPFIRPGEVYEIRAALTSASVKQLREAGTDYPQWVLDRYLQLPETITPRTRELAEKITGTQDNPYDKSQAVTDFLRTTIEYSERIEAPPNDQERVDWLLFNYRKGYCNYYASAQVILLRAVGIPARIAVGYSEGEGVSGADEEAVPGNQPGLEGQELETVRGDITTYVVRQENLHAWPEVYFPGIGWVEFEPTASQLPLFRPSGITPDDPETPENESLIDPQNSLNNRDEQAQQQDLLPPLEQETQRQRIVRITLEVLAVIGGVGLMFIALRGIRRRMPPEPLVVQLESRMRRIGLRPPKFLTRWAQQVSLPLLTRAYLEINRALRRMGVPPQASDTPAERVSALTKILPVVSEPANYLLDQYQASTYSPHPVDESTASEAGKKVRNESLIARLNRLLARWQEPSRSR